MFRLWQNLAKKLSDGFSKFEKNSKKLQYSKLQMTNFNDILDFLEKTFEHFFVQKFVAPKLFGINVYQICPKFKLHKSVVFFTLLV